MKKQFNVLWPTKTLNRSYSIETIDNEIDLVIFNPNLDKRKCTWLKINTTVEAI